MSQLQRTSLESARPSVKEALVGYLWQPFILSSLASFAPRDGSSPVSCSYIIDWQLHVHQPAQQNTSQLAILPSTASFDYLMQSKRQNPPRTCLVWGTGHLKIHRQTNVNKHERHLAHQTAFWRPTGDQRICGRASTKFISDES
jgi:hypothetical protein